MPHICACGCGKDAKDTYRMWQGELLWFVDIWHLEKFIQCQCAVPLEDYRQGKLKL